MAKLTSMAVTLTENILRHLDEVGEMEALDRDGLTVGEFYIAIMNLLINHYHYTRSTFPSKGSNFEVTGGVTLMNKDEGLVLEIEAGRPVRLVVK